MCLGHGVKCLSPFVGKVEVRLITVATTLFSISTFVRQLDLRDVLKGVKDTIHVPPLFGVNKGTEFCFIVCRTLHGDYSKYFAILCCPMSTLVDERMGF